MQFDTNGLEILSTEECARLLGTRSLGRVALSSGALPVILPVNYAMDGHRIVIRTRRSTRLAAATRDTVVVFEVDDVDPDTGAGWSVMVQGTASQLPEAFLDDPAATTAGLARWIDGDSSCLIVVTMDIVSGRRLSEVVA